jgi:hypothetical protein
VGGSEAAGVGMKTVVEFRSDRFPAYDGEDEQINPGIFGKRLAEFISEGLGKQGFEPEELFTEDWGWVIPIKNEGFRLWIACANYEEYPDGFLCFIEPNKPFIRRFLKKIATQSRVEALQRALDKTLSEEPGIRAKNWWTDEEFNKPNVNSG